MVILADCQLYFAMVKGIGLRQGLWWLLQMLGMVVEVVVTHPSCVSGRLEAATG